MVYLSPMVKCGLTKEMLIAWGGVPTFNQGLALCNEGLVSQVAYNPDTHELQGKIQLVTGWEMPVSFQILPGNRVKSDCPCRTNRDLGQICPHVLAIGIAQMVMEMDDLPPPPPRRSAPSAAKGKAPDEPSAAEDASNFIPVEMRPAFSAFVAGSRASLAIELDAHYGEVEFPACSVQTDRTVWLPDPDDALVRRVRSMKAEQAAIEELKRRGFEPGYRTGDLKFYLTDPQKVLNFLGAGLPALRRLGWRVDLADRLMKLTDTMPMVVPVVSVRDAPKGDFDIAYTFDAMGQNVPPAEVQAALNRGDGYILRDGQVILLDNVAIQEMHAVFSDCAPRQNGAPAGWFRVPGVHAAYVKASLDALDVELDDERAQLWRKNAALHSRANAAKFEPVALGPLDKILRPYQKEGVYWMRFLEESGLGGLLADEMGLGKTLQTLTWLSLPRASGTGKRPALVVCPTSLLRNWEAEAHKFIPDMKVLVVAGPDREKSFPLIPSADLVITSYGLLQRDLDTAYAETVFSAVVLDEAQHIKNRQTKSSRAVKQIQSERRLVLTGTPIENSVADVWSIFDFLMPGYLGDYETFRLHFEEPIAAGGTGGEEAQACLKRKLHPFILRRLKKSVAKELPDKIIKVSYCPLSEDGQREYVAALAKTRQQAGELVKAKGFAKSKFELLSLLMKLRQIASRGKQDAFREQLLAAIEGGHKILVFSQFVGMLRLIAADLQKLNIKFCYLDGATRDRLGECNRFNRSADIPVFLISLMAGGTGLNLTGADMVIHYDPWWNPAVEDQATDRAHRIGQKKTVYAIKMIASHTIEEKVLALQRRKQAIIAATISTTDAAVMEKLTAADLKELLS